MNSSGVEVGRQQADLFSKTGGGGPENSSHQVLGQSSQGLHAAILWLNSTLRGAIQQVACS